MFNGGMMKDTVVNPGETYKVYLVNDTNFIADVLSVDDVWIEFAVARPDGSYGFETYQKSMIKKLTPDKKMDVYVLENDEDEARFSKRKMSSDEIVYSRSKSNAIILDTRDEAVEFIKDLKDREQNEGKAYKVKTEEGLSYESF